MSIQDKQISCPVCSMNDVSFIQPYRHHHPIFANRSIVRCNHCQMVFVDPMPDEASLQQYNAGYFDNAHGGMQTHPLTVAFHSAINLLRVLYVEQFQKKNNIAVNSVLEIGPGGGHFARHWMKRNPHTTQYTGVESDISCHANLIGSGIDTHSSIDQVPPGRQFDLVVISHVLEHTHNPSGFIKKCTEPLRTGGLLFIEVPCSDYRHKESVEPHLLFFDKEPMNLFLTNMGFSHILVSYHGNTISSLQKGLSIFGKLAGRIRNLFLIKGIITPFSGKQKGMEEIDNALERAVIKPFKAHVEQDNPAWWLRAIAIKK